MTERRSSDAGGEGEHGSSSLGRGLAILRAIGSTPPYVSLRQLHKMTGLPKPSIVRLLERFIADGYVVRTAKRGCYRLTAALPALVRSWDPVWLAVDAVEREPQLLANYKWPVAIGTRDGGTIVVLFSTRRAGSPNTFRPSTFGAHASLLFSAMGEAYLAYCDDAERRRAAAHLAGSAAGPDAVLKDVNRIAIETRARGYGLRVGGKGEDTSVSVPIFGIAGELIGVIVESSFASVTSASVIKESARDLTATAQAIQARIDGTQGTQSEPSHRFHIPPAGKL